MASELRIIYPTPGANLYAVIRRKTDSKVWDTVGSSFVTWADGDIAKYDVALTEQGGDLYTADMPAGIVSTTVIIVYYNREGVAPAITDPPLKTILRSWNGVTLEDSDVTLSGDAYTDLTKVKRYLGIINTESDTLLTEFINSVSNRMNIELSIESLKATNYTEEYDGDGSIELVLRHSPVITVTSVEINNQAFEFICNYADGIIRLVSNGSYPQSFFRFAKGWQNIEVIYRAGYETVPDDLDMLCRELVADAFNKSKRHRVTSSDNGGDYFASLARELDLDNGLTVLRRYKNNIKVGVY